MLSPTWAFGVPAALLMGLGALILCVAGLYATGVMHGEPRFGVSWTIMGTFMVTTGHFAAIMALATHFYGVRQGFRPMRPVLRKLEPVLTLENALLGGGGAMLGSMLSLAAIGFWWSAHGFAALPSTLPLLLAIGLGVVGVQTALGGFLLV